MGELQGNGKRNLLEVTGQPGECGGRLLGVGRGGGQGTSCLPPTFSLCPLLAQTACMAGGAGQGPSPVYTGRCAPPPSEEPFVLEHIHFINNEIETGIYLFMIEFKSPIRSYIYFSCPFAKNLLKFLLM